MLATWGGTAVATIFNRNRFAYQGCFAPHSQRTLASRKHARRSALLRCGTRRRKRTGRTLPNLPEAQLSSKGYCFRREAGWTSHSEYSAAGYPTVHYTTINYKSCKALRRTIGNKNQTERWKIQYTVRFYIESTCWGWNMDTIRFLI